MLLKTLNDIRKRYYDLFFQRCLAFGVPDHVVQEIGLFLNEIHKKALLVKRAMNSNYEEESDSGS